jgi:purine-nucleoside phosphorylase
MAGQNALKGPNDERFGPRFCALSDAYDHDLRYSFFEAAKELGVTRPIHEGVYAFLSGPNYETRAEIRMLRIMGVDCVGMSTVPEIVTARHSGMRTFAVSLVTNVAVHDKYPSGRQQLESSLSAGKANHEEVIEAGKQAAKDIQRIIASFVGEL